jgi:beta-galactosidase
MGFSDKAGGDKKGGAFDQGNNDLRQFPVGTRKFSGVPFKILDPADNEGKSIIVLRGEARNYFPDSVKGIKVDAKAKCLYFLHTAAWSGGHFAYVVNYEDGSSVEVPIRHGKDIADWHRPGNLENAKIAWKGSNPKASGIAVYCYRWENPMPEKIINTIDVVTFEGQSIVPSILAITGEK